MKHQMRRCFCETKRDKGWSKATVGSDKLHLHDADADADAIRTRQPPLLSPDLGPPLPARPILRTYTRCSRGACAVYSGGGDLAAPWQQRACVRACV